MNDKVLKILEEIKAEFGTEIFHASQANRFHSAFSDISKNNREYKPIRELLYDIIKDFDGFTKLCNAQHDKVDKALVDKICEQKLSDRVETARAVGYLAYIAGYPSEHEPIPEPEPKQKEPNDFALAAYAWTALLIFLIFRIAPLDIDTTAKAVPGNPMRWYNWGALIGLGIALITFITLFFKRENVSKKIISFVVALGCAAAGLSPLLNVEYNEISIFGTYTIPKSTAESKLSTEDITNVEEYVFNNIDNIGYIRNSVIFRIIAFSFFVILCVYLLVRLICSSIVFKIYKKRTDIIRETVIIIPFIMAIAYFLNPNLIGHQINQMAGKTIVKELQINSNELFFSGGEEKASGYWLKPDGTFYEGEFVANTITGKGRYTNSSGITYDGTFVFGKLYGDVKVYAPDGSFLFESTIASGDVDTAVFDMANELYSSGDYETCYNIASKLAEFKIPRALNFLAIMYNNGHYVEQNFEKAYTLYTEAIELGETRAISNMGLMYFNGEYVEQDQTRAVELWREEAEKELYWAQYLYAMAIYHGYGIEKNIDESIKWYEKASSEDIRAMYELGMIYMFGFGTNVDEERGMTLLTASSDSGNKNATAFLRAYDDNKSLIEALETGISDIEDLSLLSTYESLHFAMQSTPTSSIEIPNAVEKFVHVTNGTLNSTMSKTAEYLLLQSLLEYLNREAPSDEKNLFIVMILLHAGNGYNETELDKLYNMLRDKNPEHIALTLYDSYKSLVGTFAVTNIIESSIKRFEALDVISHGWNSDSEQPEIFITDEASIPILARMILLSFGDSSSADYMDEMETFLRSIYAVNKESKVPMLLTDLQNYNPGSNIKSTIDNMIDFFW